MATEVFALPGILDSLGSSDWVAVLDGVQRADSWLADAEPGEDGVGGIINTLAALCAHPKWEVRRAVASTAAARRYQGFDSAINRLIADENARVRQAAEAAVLRRRDQSHNSLFGKQHEKRLNGVLDDIEVKFGTRGRDAVRRVAEEIAGTFSRELYHEIIKLLSPLALAAERLRISVAQEELGRSEIEKQAARIEALVQRVGSVMDAMKGYSYVPQLEFSEESLDRLVREAVDVATVRSQLPTAPTVTVDIKELMVEVDRSRFLQALTNLLSNALESYDGMADVNPIEISASTHGGTVHISVRDRGCGMAMEAAQDARELFVTSKKTGTGFGLPLAVRIIEEEHSGRLTVESVKGVGTNVSVAIPMKRGVA